MVSFSYRYINAFINISDVNFLGLCFRLLWGIVFAVFVYFTPGLIHSNGSVNVPAYYYLGLGFVYLINEVSNGVLEVYGETSYRMGFFFFLIIISYLPKGIS